MLLAESAGLTGKEEDGDEVVEWWRQQSHRDVTQRGAMRCGAAAAPKPHVRLLSWAGGNNKHGRSSAASSTN